MKASIRFCRISLALALAGACPLVLAQSGQKQETTKTSTFYIQTADSKAVSGEPGPNNFAFIKSEMAFEGGVVKGAPYSAQGTTTFTQTLADGNRINRQTNSQIYRDGEGRTRREETIAAIGPWASGSDAFQIIHINDPVTGNAFMLNPKDHTATKIMISFNKIKQPGAVGAAGTVVSGDTLTVHMAAPPLPPPPPPAPVGAIGMAVALPPELHSLNGLSYAATKGQVSTESLGTQEIEGIQAEGTRTTFTIPAGQIGNEQPIQVIGERWYSPDLQVVVMSRHSDPRTGEEVYKLTNISRSEPAHQLFEVPADYTVKEGGDAIRTFKLDKGKKQNEQ